MVTDKGIAEWLADQFPGCALAPIGDAGLVRRGQPGRKRLYPDQKARTDAYRQRTLDQEKEIQLAQMIPGIQNGAIWLTRNPNNVSSEIVSLKASDSAESAPEEAWFADLSFLRDQLLVGTLAPASP